MVATIATGEAEQHQLRLGRLAAAVFSRIAPLLAPLVPHRCGGVTRGMACIWIAIGTVSDASSEVSRAGHA